MCWRKVLTFQSSHRQNANDFPLPPFRVDFHFGCERVLVYFKRKTHHTSGATIFCDYFARALRLQRLTPSVWNGMVVRWHQTHVAGVDVLSDDTVTVCHCCWFDSHQTVDSFISCGGGIYELIKAIPIFISEMILFDFLFLEIRVVFRRRLSPPLLLFYLLTLFLTHLLFKFRKPQVHFVTKELGNLFVIVGVCCWCCCCYLSYSPSFTACEHICSIWHSSENRYKS